MKGKPGLTYEGKEMNDWMTKNKAKLKKQSK